MRKFLLLLSLVFVVILVATAGAVVYLYLQWPAEKVLAQVNDFLVRDYGMKVEISSARLDWLRGISLQDPKLVEKNGVILLEAKEIVARYDLLALLQKTIKFSRLSISGLYTTQENMTKVIARFQKRSSQSKSKAPFHLLIHQLVFVDSQILYNKIPITITITWNLGTFQKPATYNGSLVSLYGDASFYGKGNTIRFQLKNVEVSRFFPAVKDLIFQTMAGELFLQKDQWVFRGNSLSLLWQSNTISSPQYTLAYDTRKQEVVLVNTRVMFNKSEVIFSNLFYSVPQKMAYGEAKSFEIRLGDFVPDAEGELKGQLQFQYEDAELTQLDGKLVLEGISYGPLRGTGEFIIDGFTLDGEASFSVGKNTFLLRSSPIGRRGLAFSLTAEEVDLVHLLQQKWPRRGSSSKGFSSSSSKQAFSLEKLITFLPLAVDVAISRLVYHKLAAEDLRFTMLPRSSFFVIEEMGFHVLRGKVQGRATLAGDFIRGQVLLSDIRLHDLNEGVLKDGKSLYGTLRGNIQYQIPLTNMMASYALFSFVMEKPEFRNFVLQNQFSEVLYNLPLERLSFDSLVVNGEMRDGILLLKETTLNSYDIQVKAPASFVLSNQKVDADIGLSLSRDYMSGLPNVAQLLTAGYAQDGRIFFRLKISNTLSQPKVILLPAGGQ